MFSAYFDASGTERDKFVSVAGFIASAEVWINFEKAWLERLTRAELFGKDGEPEFRMSDCANYRYAFESWRGDEPKRQNLLRDLVKILTTLGRRACCVIDVNQYKARLDKDIRDQFGLSGAYVLGGRACAARVKEWCWKDGAPQLSQVRFFFEHGDGRDLQADLEFRFLDDDYPRPIFGLKRNKYSDKTGERIEERLVPFQAADVLAYLIGQEAKSVGGNWRDKEPIQWMLDELSPIPEPTLTFPDELMAGLNIYLRAASHNLLNPTQSRQNQTDG